MAHYPKVTPQKKGKFLAELRQHGNATAASRATGVTRRNWYKHREHDVDFAADWDDAREQYAEEVLEREADRRAVQGVHHRTYFDKDGNPIGEERRYSDTLLIFRLKALKPHVYKETGAFEVSGTGGQPIQHHVEQSHEYDNHFLAAVCALLAEHGGLVPPVAATNGHSTPVE